MTALLGPYFGACLLLVVAGPAKLFAPGDLARALQRSFSPGNGDHRSARLPSSLVLAVRFFALCEMVVGAVGFADPRLGAPFVCASYLLFAAAVVWVRRRGGVLATCGCFGGIDSPATRTHIVLNLGAAGSSLCLVLRGHEPTIWHLAASQPLVLFALVGGAAVASWLAALVMGAHGTLAATRRLLGGFPPVPGAVR